MNLDRPVVDPGLFDWLSRTTNLISAVCDIQSNPRTTDSFGQPIMTDDQYTTEPGLDAIPCFAPAPMMPVRPTDTTEVKSTTGVQDQDIVVIYLLQYCPQIQKQWRAVVTTKDGIRVVYDITGRDSDSQHNLTRLKAQVFQV